MNHQKELRRRRKQKAVRLHRKMVRRSDRPRLAVFRSNRFIYAQVIDDRAGHTVAAASSLEKGLGEPAAAGDGAPKPEAAAPSGDAPAGDAKKKAPAHSGKVAVAHRVGLALAERAKKAGIEKVVFDRRHYRYHGRIQALADGARKGGLSF